MHEKDWYVYGPIIIFVVGLTLYCVLRAKKGDRKDQLFGCSFMAGSFLLVFGGIVVTCTSGILWDGEHTNEESDYVEKFNIVDEKKHGLYESRHKSNNTLKQKGQYDMGEKIGLWQTWYESGQLESSTDYSVYNPFRLKVEWHENGQVASKSYYDEEGRWESHLEETYYENGQQKSEGSMGWGWSQESCRAWYENGQLEVEVVWEDGVLLKFQRFNEDGSPCEYSTYKDGNGIVVQEYNWDGKPSKILVFKDYKKINVMSESY